MTRARAIAAILVLAGASAAAGAWPWPGSPLVAAMPVASANGRAAAAAARVRPAIEAALEAQGKHWGTPIHLRLYKAERQLEVWLAESPRWRLYKVYPICTYSGALGPKTKQGDGQAPEGFYRVGAGQLNPASRYHLAFNLGYPNAYDRARGYTGDYLMVHGNCVSIGCYAMGDAAIEEIYTLVAAAIDGGQSAVPVHVFPFRMDRADDPRLADPRWGPFWSNLREGYRWFVEHGVPPAVSVKDRTYVFGAP